MNLTASDIISLLAILISLFTLTVTLYLQYMKKGRVVVFAGDTLQLHYSKDHKNFNFVLNLSFSNKGAQPAVVVGLKGVITFNDKHPMSFTWVAFAESKNIAADGSYKPALIFSFFSSHKVSRPIGQLWTG